MPSSSSSLMQTHVARQATASGRVVRIDQPFARPGAVVGGCIRELAPADHAVAPVDRDMEFVAEHRDRDVDRLAAVSGRFGFAELHGPARLRIFLCRPGGLVRPDLRSALAGFDVGLLGFGVALARRCHQRGVHDLARHGEIAMAR